MNSQKIKIKLLDGQEFALKEFFDANYPIFCSFAAKFINNSSVCEDIVQEAFVSFWEKEKVFVNNVTIKSFFYKTIRNSCLDYLKHEQVKNKFLGYEYDRVESSEFFLEEVLKNEAYKIIYHQVNKLPTTGRKIILFALKGMSNEDIAQELNIAVNTVKTHKARAYATLRNELSHVFLLYISLKNNFKA
ncbi:RNA polymerase sigma-70 factor [Puteibacter caeruleilacunae]|nr:RNA polymerase sigma-70 factor [Puteibacter caeruleilacunae]